MENENLGIEIPPLNGNVHIFDYDDTLFWTPEWHSGTKTDSAGSLVEAGKFAMAVKSALSFIEEVNLNPESLIKSESANAAKDLKNLIPMRLIKSSAKKAGEAEGEVVFLLIDKGGNTISPSLFKSLFSSKQLKPFDLKDKYIPGAVCIGTDHTFYGNLDTLGTEPNDEILSILKGNIANSVILTARLNSPGMEDRIRDIIKSKIGSAPSVIFTRPKHLSSGRYKALVIAKIAEQRTVSKIFYYDDNQAYIDAVEREIEQHSDDVKAKLSVTLVAPPKIIKENSNLSMIKKMVKVSNKLDTLGLTSHADAIDNILKKMAGKKKVLYTAVFPKDESIKSEIKDWWTNTVGGLLDMERIHHITICFKPSMEEVLATDFGSDVKFKIVGWAEDKKVQAIVVSGIDSNKEVPHMTISTKDGVPPSESNKLLSEGYHIVDGPEFDGTIGYWNGSKAVFEPLEKSEI